MLSPMVHTGAIRFGSVKGPGAVELCKKNHLISDMKVSLLMRSFAYSRLNSYAEHAIVASQDSLIVVL